MKSRVGVGSCPSKVRIEQTKDQLETVGELIDDSAERDVILIGDFNHRTDHQSFEPLTDADFIFQTRFLNQASAAGSYIKTWNPHKSEDLIDHILLFGTPTPERSSVAARPSTRSNRRKPAKSTSCDNQIMYQFGHPSISTVT